MATRRIIVAASLTTAALASAAILSARQQVVMTQTVQNADVVRIGPNGPLTNGLAGGDKPMQAGTGLILGQAIDAATKRPIPGAVVTLSTGGFMPAVLMADAEGHFAFRDLPAGRFTLTARRPGYADGGFGRVRPEGPSQPISLAADQRMGDVTIPLWKFAAIGGTVTDEHGDPLVGAPVRVLRQLTMAGKRQLREAGTDFTDDRGFYRIGSLVPGEYIVALPMTPPADGGPIFSALADRAVAVAGLALAGGGGGGNTFNMSFSDFSGGSDTTTAGIAPDGHLLLYPTMFFPTAATASRATLIPLTSGEDHQGVDFQVRPMHASSVSGSLIGPDGPVGGVAVRLIPTDAEDLVTSIGTPTTVSDPQGRFTFKAVTPGQYTLSALRSPNMPGETMSVTTSGGQTQVFRMAVRTVSDGAPPPLPTDATLWLEQPLQVGNTDVANVVASLRPTARVNGLLSFNGAAVKPTGDQLQAISVNLESADGRSQAGARGRIDPNGTFQTMGVPPGKYIVRVDGAPKDWKFYGAMMGGKDVSVDPIEISAADVSGVSLTFTDKPAGLSGTVTKEGGSADTLASVLVFPQDPESWVGHGSQPRRLQSVRVNRDGTYTFANLPPGRYFVVAVNDATAPDLNPKFLDGISRQATRIDIGEGEQKKQALQSVTPEVR